MDLKFCKEFMSEIRGNDDKNLDEWFEVLEKDPLSHFSSGLKLFALELERKNLRISDVVFGIGLGVSLGVISDHPEIKDQISDSIMMKGVPWKQ